MNADDQTDSGATALQRLVAAARPAVNALNLDGVRATRIAAELIDPTHEPPYVMETALAGGFGYTDDSVGVDLDYTFTARTETQDEPVWQLNLVLHLKYHLLEGAQMPSEDALRAYAVTAAPFMAHPYARENIHAMTLRLGVPAFVLPVMRSIADITIYGEPEVGTPEATPL